MHDYKLKQVQLYVSRQKSKEDGNQSKNPIIPKSSIYGYQTIFIKIKGTLLYR